MPNDLSKVEKALLRRINQEHGTHYNYKHLAEWSSDCKRVKRDIEEGEILYEVEGLCVAIDPNKLKRYRKEKKSTNKGG